MIRPGTQSECCHCQNEYNDQYQVHHHTLHPGNHSICPNHNKRSSLRIVRKPEIHLLYQCLYIFPNIHSLIILSRHITVHRKLRSNDPGIQTTFIVGDNIPFTYHKISILLIQFPVDVIQISKIFHLIRFRLHCLLQRRTEFLRYFVQHVRIIRKIFVSNLFDSVLLLQRTYLINSKAPERNPGKQQRNQNNHKKRNVDSVF